MAQLDDLQHLHLGLLDGLPVVGFDKNAEQRVAVEHCLRQRYRDEDDFVGVHAQPISGRSHDAGNAEAPIADAYELPDRRLGAKQFVADGRADHRFRCAASPVAWR